jgi:NDP-sugar pyrophosphorylase family protein
MIRLRAAGASARQVDSARVSRRSAEGAKLDWPALVLTAGLATRLQPLSSIRAKAALPVAGDALITRILRWLHAAGIRRVVLNLHHRADSITRLVGDGSRLDLAVRYSWETEILGSAGGPARAIPLLEADRFVIVNGDTLTNVDLRALAAQHVETNAMVTMAVVDADPRYNAIVADDAGIVTGFSKREPGTAGNPTHGPPSLAPLHASSGEVSPKRPSAAKAETPGTLGRFHFIGVQAVNAAVFAGVDPDRKSETVHGIYPGVIAARTGAIRIVHSPEDFHDIGSPKDYLETAITLAAREGRPLDRGQGSIVASNATLVNTVVWDRVTIGANARLTNCVVADDVTVPAGAHHSDCTLVMRGREMIVAPFTAPEARSSKT